MTPVPAALTHQPPPRPHKMSPQCIAASVVPASLTYGLLSTAAPTRAVQEALILPQGKKISVRTHGMRDGPHIAWAARARATPESRRPLSSCVLPAAAARSLASPPSGRLPFARNVPTYRTPRAATHGVNAQMLFSEEAPRCAQRLSSRFAHGPADDAGFSPPRAPFPLLFPQSRAPDTPFRLGALPPTAVRTGCVASGIRAHGPPNRARARAGAGVWASLAEVTLPAAFFIEPPAFSTRRRRRNSFRHSLRADHSRLAPPGLHAGAVVRAFPPSRSCPCEGGVVVASDSPSGSAAGGGWARRTCACPASQNGLLNGSEPCQATPREGSRKVVVSRSRYLPFPGRNMELGSRPPRVAPAPFVPCH